MNLTTHGKEQIAMKPDVEKYLTMIEDWSMPREQKIEFIHDLWHVMESFVDKAFGTHPVQQCRDKNRKTDLQDSLKDLDSSLSKNNLEEGTRP